jgi:hypothetical protein
MVGLCKALLNELGPVQEYVAMSSGPPVKVMFSPSQAGPSLDALASGLAYIVTLVLQLAEHPLAVVTVTEMVALPAAPAVHLILGVLFPAVIVPPVIVQL